MLAIGRLMVSEREHTWRGFYAGELPRQQMRGHRSRSTAYHLQTAVSQPLQGGDMDSMLILCAVLLVCALVGYRQERAETRQTILDLRNRPTESAAMLSAMHAALQRLERLAPVKRDLDPLPGMQAKPRRKQAHGR